LKGGDTDTNAAIVGGLIGAWYGFDAIPREWIASILNFRCTEETNHPRDDWLIPGFHLVPLTKALIVNAPSKLLIRIAGEITDPKVIEENVLKEINSSSSE
jgi:hypothetical protein